MGSTSGHSGESGESGGGVNTLTFFTGFCFRSGSGSSFGSLGSGARNEVRGGAACVCVVSIGSRGRVASATLGCKTDLRNGFDDAMLRYMG